MLVLLVVSGSGQEYVVYIVAMVSFMGRGGGNKDSDVGEYTPLRELSPAAGDASRLKLDDESPLLGWGGLGEASAVVGSENTSDGVSTSGVYALRCDCCSSNWGGSAGRDLSTFGAAGAGGFLDFFRRRAISDSWQDMQKIPCDVRAYRRFSILRLQFLHLKQFAQKAWSPVKMARSSILLPQWLQLYVQLLQIRDPSPRSSKLASESRSVPQVLQRKQSMCHLLPAVCCQYMPA